MALWSDSGAPHTFLLCLGLLCQIHLCIPISKHACASHTAQPKGRLASYVHSSSGLIASFPLALSTSCACVYICMHNLYLQSRPSEMLVFLSNCLLDISTWMSNRNVKFNMSKTKHLIHSFHTCTSPSADGILAGGIPVLLVAQAKSLPVSLDSFLPAH